MPTANAMSSESRIVGQDSGEIGWDDQIAEKLIAVSSL